MIDWGMVGAVIAAAAFGFVLRDELARRREIRDVLWMMDAFGKTDDAGNGKAAEAFELRNAGSATAHVWMFTMAGFSIWQSDDATRLRWLYGPNEARTILVQSDDVETAWLMLLYSSARDRRYLRLCWFPLTTDSDHWQADIASWDKRRWRFWRRWTLGPVGPGGRREVRFRPDMLRSEKRVKKVMAIATTRGAGSIRPGQRA